MNFTTWIYLSKNIRQIIEKPSHTVRTLQWLCPFRVSRSTKHFVCLYFTIHIYICVVNANSIFDQTTKQQTRRHTHHRNAIVCLCIAVGAIFLAPQSRRQTAQPSDINGYDAAHGFHFQYVDIGYIRIRDVCGGARMMMRRDATRHEYTRNSDSEIGRDLFIFIQTTHINHTIHRRL